MLQSLITEELVRNFDPDAVILHGSRARGMARESSDWDFILIYESETTHKNNRATMHGQNIEYTVVSLPVKDIWETFGIKLNHAKVVYEKTSVGSTLLSQAQKFYNEGVYWSDAKKESHCLWFEGRIEGMKHYIDQPEMFYKYFSDLYSRLTNYWYWLKQNKHSEPIYVAVPDIATKDPEYANLLIQLTDQKMTFYQKVEIAEQIKNFLFIKVIK
jgi:hypothetical protein